jgi:hypothetical protein
MATEIKFYNLGLKKNLQPVRIDDNRFEKIYPVIERAILDQGYMAKNLSFRWNAEGDKHYAYSTTPAQKSVVAIFTTKTVD